jgi:hypothetical protein
MPCTHGAARDGTGLNLQLVDGLNVGTAAGSSRCDTNGGCVVRRSVIVGLLLAIACSGASETDVRTRSGPTQFAGRYAYFLMYDAWVSSIDAEFGGDGGTSTSDPLPITALDLYVRDAPWSCSDLADRPQSPGDVAEVIWSLNRPKPRVFAVGDYALPGNSSDGGDWSSASYSDLRPDCLAQLSVVTSGSVTLSGLSESEAQGFMSGSLFDGTHIDGEFVATRCPAVFPDYSDGGIPEPLPLCGG